MQLGDTNAALKLLDKSFEIYKREGWSRETDLVYLLYHEFWDGLHEDPHFKALLEKIGFSKVIPGRK
jgi:hypothetical protein